MPEAQPYFAICIPVYNGETFVERAVESVLGQTFDSWFLKIIEDGSTDGTWNLLQRRYAGHPKVRLLRNEKNLGQRGNLNRCLVEGRGQWFAFLPADDAYASHALQTIYEQTSADNDMILWAHAHFVRGEGVVPNACAVFSHLRRFRATEIAETLYLKGNIFGELSSYFVRCRAFEKDGIRFSDGFLSVDTRFWIRVLRANPEGFLVYWPDSLAHVWQHSESASSTCRRDHIAYVEIFDEAGDLALLGWKKRTLLFQAARLLKCWCKFGMKLPPGSRGAPIRALKSLYAVLSRPSAAPPAR